ncbi:ABC-three component system protein, partial [Bacillus sp. JJ722]|uniref:ABC-three component system protein n=1 Tax=Bacillus sp. JJ722 TaxID=3122973 RepID=UPI0030006DCE
MELFRRLGVRIKGFEETRGSGCLFQTKEKTYVITAYHCLTSNPSKRDLNSEMSKISIVDFEGEELQIKKIYSPQDVNLDFAVIEIETNKDYAQVLIEVPKINMDYKFFGFPNYLLNELHPGDSLDGYVSEVLDDYNLILQHPPLGDIDKDAKDSTIGYSGSGMYVRKGEDYFLIGIIRALRGQGEHGKLMGMNILSINNFLKREGLPTLIPAQLMAFDLYLENIVSEEHEMNASILKKVYKENLNGISPYFLNELLNEKIVIPYDKEFNPLEEEVWKGWVRLLLYISLYKKVKINHENIKEYIYLDI